MNRLQINEQIALLLGFKKVDTENPIKWVYPMKFLSVNSPSKQTHLPDFVGMIDEYTRIIKETDGSMLDASLVIQENKNKDTSFPEIKSGDMIRLTWKKDQFYGIDEIGIAMVIDNKMMIRLEKKDVLLDDLKKLNCIDKIEVLTYHHEDLFQD